MPQTPPPSYGPLPNAPASPPPRRSAAGWWVAAGIAVVMSVVLLTVLLQGSRQPILTPTLPPTSASPGQETTELGKFAPTYKLREVFTLSFPENFEKYVKESVISYSTVLSVEYDDNAGLDFFSALVMTNTSEFASRVQSFPDPVLIGDAVCGITSEDGVLKECVMAGIDGPLIISTGGKDMTLEELARIIQAFYTFP